MVGCALARRHGLSAGQLAARIGVSTAGSSRKAAQGVQQVSLTGRDPWVDQKVFEGLAETYLNDSLSQRQEWLTAGLRFLDRQSPLLVQRANDLATQLAQFRRTNNLLELLVEGAAIRESSGDVEQQIRSLQSDRARLQVARSGVENGTL